MRYLCASRVAHAETGARSVRGHGRGAWPPELESGRRDSNPRLSAWEAELPEPESARRFGLKVRVLVSFRSESAIGGERRRNARKSGEGNGDSFLSDDPNFVVSALSPTRAELVEDAQQVIIRMLDAEPGGYSTTRGDLLRDLLP